MRARAVIGSSFGDCGKGLTVDHLCATEGAGMVVRFNAGANAGHTVCTPDGRRHVFSHFGAGSFLGIPTFFSQFCILNPILFFRELTQLRALGVDPVVYAHPQCLITTFADMIVNQRKEDARGLKRHGSCGVGIHETMERSRVISLTMADLWNHTGNLESKLEEICGKYASFRTGRSIDEPGMAQAFIRGCWAFADHVHPLGIAQCKDPVFEGAQGLLLDQDNTEFRPHVTHSHTGAKNVRFLCHQAGITKLDLYYVSRTYLTRHGAGPLPGEYPTMQFEDKTNLEHPYQGRLRFAPLDYAALEARCAEDAGTDAFQIVLTHCDQLAPAKRVMIEGHGERRTDINRMLHPKRLRA